MVASAPNISSLTFPVPCEWRGWPWRPVLQYWCNKRQLSLLGLVCGMRLTPAEVRALRTAFRDSPDLEKRLALGEWSALKLGEVVAEGYDAVLHAPQILSPNHQLAIGWDGGHTPSAVIGQLINNQVRIYAALNDMKAGVLQLIEEQVAPWLIQYAPWARHGGGGLTQIIDPSMATGSQSDIRDSAERVIRDTLRGAIVKGPVAWAPRRE